MEYIAQGGFILIAAVFLTVFFMGAYWPDQLDRLEAAIKRKVR